ncbi:MAG: hypothetical protein OIF47_15410 [Marinibacterium sp.]|nr:hypothetical protein [Marinibacterium sp.]
MRALLTPSLALCLALGLAACGADGEPIRPSAALSVSGGSSGVRVGGGVAAQAGPFSIFVGR